MGVNHITKFDLRKEWGYKKKNKSEYIPEGSICPRCSRDLREIENSSWVTHHVDMDRKNNHHSNLVDICIGCHRTIHNRCPSGHLLKDLEHSYLSHLSKIVNNEVNRRDGLEDIQPIHGKLDKEHHELQREYHNLLKTNKSVQWENKTLRRRLCKFEKKLLRREKKIEQLLRGNSSRGLSARVR